MTEKPRYSRITDLIELIILMSSSSQGVTIPEIMEEFNVSRKTAERMRDCLRDSSLQVDDLEIDDTHKHWGFTNYSVAHMISFTEKEVANLRQLQKRTTNKELKQELEETISKILSMNRNKKQFIEKNIELFMQTEGYAVRQMPQYKISPETVSTIRDAIQNSKKVRGIYHEKERLIEPLGLIYGEKIYLVAREKAKGEGVYNYFLNKFDNMKLTNETFDREDFDLTEYTNLSFGIYHGELMDVELSFSKELAEEAANYNFHPTQQIQKEEDGTLTVKFRAGGNREIIWHVFKWGAGCKVIAPQKLKDDYKEYLQSCLGNF